MLRYGFFYGPGTWYDRDGAVGQDDPQAPLPGHRRRQGRSSFVHVDDAVDATVRALDARRPRHLQRHRRRARRRSASGCPPRPRAAGRQAAAARPGAGWRGGSPAPWSSTTPRRCPATATPAPRAALGWAPRPWRDGFAEVARLNATGRFAPTPDRRRCTWATCAPRCWRGCTPARRARAFLLRVEDLDTGRVRAALRGASSSPTCARSASTGTASRCASPSAPERYADALARLDADGPALPVLVHAGRDPRGRLGAARRAARGRLPGDLPRADRRRSAPSARPRAGRRRCACAPARRASRFTDRLHGDGEGVVDDFVVRRNDGAFAYNLAVVVDDARAGRRRGRARRRPPGLHAAPALARRARSASPPPAHAHVPLVLGPDGARLAKRHGAVTLADRARAGRVAAEVRARLAASVGLAEPGERPSPPSWSPASTPARSHRRRRVRCRASTGSVRGHAAVDRRHRRARPGDGAPRHRHRVHGRRPLPAAALPRPDRASTTARAARRGRSSSTRSTERRRPRRRWPTCSPTRRSRSSCTPARQDVALLRRDWGTATITQRLRHAGRRRLRRACAPSSATSRCSRRCSACGCASPRVHALGRPPADRGAARLRARGRPAPAAGSPTRCRTA